MAITRRNHNALIIIDHPDPVSNIKEDFREIPKTAMVKMSLLPFKAKVALAITLGFSSCFYLYIMKTLLTNQLTQENFLEVSTCPACYGQSFCSNFLSGNYTFAGLSSVRFLDFTNVKNVHMSKSGHQKIVLKKLGHNTELKNLDARICTDAGYPEDCDSSRAIYQTKSALVREMSPNVVKGLSPSMHCASQRLVDRIVEYYKERKYPDEFHMDDKMQLIATLMINAEPVIMQMFPPSEGYPFPSYLGSCGRFSAVEYVGHTLDKHYNKAWEERIDFAYQLMRIADFFTENQLGFSFYLTDVTYDNIAVNRDGKIIFIDLEDILIVDKAKLRRDKPSGWDTPLYSEFSNCAPGETDCTSYSPDDLCAHDTTDHNYYMVCRNILSEYSGDTAHAQGLLHDIPDNVETNYQLKMLVRECAKPLLKNGRLKVKDQLLKALGEIRKDYL